MGHALQKWARKEEESSFKEKEFEEEFRALFREALKVWETDFWEKKVSETNNWHATSESKIQKRKTMHI